VRLTQGYWLADTACTQALWLAVRGGKNPSRFADDPARPVEYVSFDEVQKFLDRFARHVPGATAVLPTEAQWEFACRAGTVTAFHYGEEASPEHMNFDERQSGTMQVKSYTPNAWGLYDMHGNVWEWCSDADRVFSTELAVDPVGRRDGGREAHRAVRGGLLNYDASNCRSAYRGAGRLGYPWVNLGFRLALRSTSQARSGAPEVPGLQAAEQPIRPGAEPQGQTGRDARPPQARQRAPNKAAKSTPARRPRSK